MKTFEIIIPRRVAFTEYETYYIDAESQDEAIKLMDSGAYEPDYEDAGDYETISTYEIEIKEIENANIHN
jgi:hypothetical protein